MKRILIFSTAYLPMQGGAELAVNDIASRVIDCEFNLICARLRRDLPKNEKIGRVDIFRVGFGSKIDKILLPFLGFLAARKIYKQQKEKIILWGIMASWGSLAALVFKIIYPQVPFLLTLQEGDTKEYIMRGRWGFISLSWRWLLKKADFVQAISNYLVKTARSFGYKGRIEIVPNGVNLNNYDLGIGNYELRKRMGIGDEEKVVITVSRLAEKNGIGDLIKALKLLVAKYHISVKLLILGSGLLESKLKKQVENLDLKAKIIFLGDIPNNEVPEYLALADIFVRPSLSEGLGTAFLEAMAAGVPIVGTWVGGIPDFLSDYETGLFCEINNPESAAEKINLLLNDEILRKKLIFNSQKLIKEKYDWNKIAKKMGDIFNKLSA